MRCCGRCGENPGQPVDQGEAAGVLGGEGQAWAAVGISGLVQICGKKGLLLLLSRFAGGKKGLSPAGAAGGGAATGGGSGLILACWKGTAVCVLPRWADQGRRDCWLAVLLPQMGRGRKGCGSKEGER